MAAIERRYRIYPGLPAVDKTFADDERMATYQMVASVLASARVEDADTGEEIDLSELFSEHFA